MAEFPLAVLLAGYSLLCLRAVSGASIPLASPKKLLHLLTRVRMHKVHMGGNISQVQLKVKVWQWDVVKSHCWHTWQQKDLTH